MDVETPMSTKSCPIEDRPVSLDMIERSIEKTNGERAPSTARIIAAGATMLLTYYLGTVSQQSVIIAIPSMARDLKLSELETQWVSSAYSLAYGCGMLFCGRVADLYGRKLCYITGLGIFCLFNIISANVKPPPVLFVMRAFAGLGLALAGPAGFGLVGEYVREEPARSRVFVTFGLGGPVGAATGAVLGGAISGIDKHRAWTYLFYIFAGLSLIPMTAGYLLFPEKLFAKLKTKARLDFIGGLLITAAISLFLFSLVQSGNLEKGWREPYVPALFITSIILFVVFFLWERRLEHNIETPPAIKVSLFTRQQWRFTAVLLCAFFTFFATSGWVYTTTIFYQNLKGMSPLQNAIHVLPCAILGIAVGFIAMWACDKAPAPTMFYIASGLMGIASLLYAVIPPETSYWASGFVAQLFIPWGPDFVICIGNILVANMVDRADQSVGGAIFSTSYTIGGGLGTALSSLVVTGRQNAGASLLGSLKAAFGFTAAMAWFVALVVFIGLRHVGIARDSGPKM